MQINWLSTFRISNIFSSLLSHSHDEPQTLEMGKFITEAVNADDFFVWPDFVARLFWWESKYGLVSGDLIAIVVKERDWADITPISISILGLNSGDFPGGIKVNHLSVVKLLSIPFEKRRFLLVWVDTLYSSDSAIILVITRELQGGECDTCGHLCEDGFGRILEVDHIPIRVPKQG